MAANLEGLVSPKYARSLLSANMRLLAEMQTHLWRIQELAISISEPNEYNEFSTLDCSAGAIPVHCGVGRGSLSIAFSSRIDDKGTGYISEISITEDKTGKHTLKDDARSKICSSASPSQRFEPTLGYNASSKSSLFLPPPASHFSSPRQGVTQAAGSTNQAVRGDIDSYFDDIDEFYLAMAASEAVHAKRRALAPNVRKGMSRGVYTESRTDIPGTAARTLPHLQKRHDNAAEIQRCFADCDMQSTLSCLSASGCFVTPSLNSNEPRAEDDPHKRTGEKKSGKRRKMCLE